MLIPSMGVWEPATARATRSNVPSPPKTSSRSTCAARAVASAHTGPRRRARRAVSPLLRTLRPVAAIRRDALLTAEAQEDFSEFPISPMRLILSDDLFNQHQKFFVSCRAEKGRLSESKPLHYFLAGDETFQLT